MSELTESTASYESLTNYINTAWQKINELGINLSDSYVDHIGIRVNWGENGEGDYSRYVELKKAAVASGGEIISEAIIPMNEDGRPISIIKLKVPIQTEAGLVEFLEIPAPRKGKVELEVVDHIEIVVSQKSLKEFADKNQVQLSNANVLNLEGSLANEASGKINPDITIDLGDGLRVKFHTSSIKDIVLHEQSGLPELDALNEKFRVNNPGVMD
jgi:predicted metalloenzyme YecM